MRDFFLEDKVLMIGANLNSVVGVASAIRSIQNSNIYSDIVYIHPNSIGGNNLKKISSMVTSYIILVCLIPEFFSEFLSIKYKGCW